MFKIQQVKPRPQAGRNRGGNTSLTVLGTVAGFLVVLGAAWFVVAPSDRPVAQPQPADVAVADETAPEIAPAVEPAISVEASQPVVEPVVMAVDTTPVIDEPKTPTTREQIEAFTRFATHG